MADPLSYETPPPLPKERPFWPEGWNAAELVFLFVWIFGGRYADDYFAALGWSDWLRALILLIVLYVGFWLFGPVAFPSQPVVPLL